MYGDRWNPYNLKNLYFNSLVAGLYVNTLRELSRGFFGVDYASYDLVETMNVHSLDVPLMSVYWPVIHVLKNRYSSTEFEGLVDSLNGEDAYDIIKRVESPQNYRMGEVKILRERRIKPLLLEDKKWVVKGSELKQAMDFLVPFILEYKHETTPLD